VFSAVEGKKASSQEALRVVAAEAKVMQVLKR
jgi:hypothetical protein